MYTEKMFIVSLRFDWLLIICTSGKFEGILLHVGRTSSEKSAVNAMLGGILLDTTHNTGSAIHKNTVDARHRHTNTGR